MIPDVHEQRAAPTTEPNAPAAPQAAETLLQIENLQTHFFTRRGVVKVIDGLNLSLKRGQILGLVGESGSGKSVTGFSILQMVRKPGKVVGGRIMFKGHDLLQRSRREMREIRGREIAMIFQDPRAALNPTMTVGQLLRQVLRYRRGLSGAAIDEAATELLRMVHISDPARRLSAYPHQLSGGMCQRVVIALALACRPELLIADEPTTGLDVTIQQQIVQLLRDLRDTLGTTQVVITHDLGMAADLCDVIAVMYGGDVVELAPTHELFNRPRHPYTIALLKSRPIFGSRNELYVIRGSVPDFVAPPSGCRFHPRCDYAFDRCSAERPPKYDIAANHTSACFLAEPHEQPEPPHQPKEQDV